MGMFSSTKDFMNQGGNQAADIATLGAYGTLTHGNADKADISGDQAKRDAAIADLKASAPQSIEAYKNTGEYKPTLLGNMPQQSASEMGQIFTDPNSRGAQLQALAQLQSRATDGYNAEDKAAMAQTMDQTAQEEASQRGALQANMQARGMGGSGAELAAQLANQQGAASRNNTAGLQIAANGRAQALQAAMQSGQLGGQMQSQEFNQKAQQAQAQDAINRFNTTTGVNAANTNNQTTNNAALYNTQANQAQANKTTDQANNFGQQKFANQNTVTGVQYGASTNDANQKIGQQAADQAAIDKSKDRYVGAVIGGASAAGKFAGGGTTGAAAPTEEDPNAPKR